MRLTSWIARRFSPVGVALALGWMPLAATARAPERLPPFRFAHDTFAFANETVFAYRDGVPHLRHGKQPEAEPYNRRCFIMAKSVDQFRKFARFEPAQPPVDNAELARRVRAVARRQAWTRPLPREQRIVFPGYADLRALSVAHSRVLQENIGLGWPTYVRFGNWRMVICRGGAYQAWTHEALAAALARGDVFCGYLTDFPHLHINHAILVYARKPPGRDGAAEHYWAYDSNHPEAPRDLAYDPAAREFSYQKDWDFVGGKVTVLQIFNYWMQ